MKTKMIVATIVTALTGTVAVAGDDNFSSSFGGSVGAFSKSGGASFTSSYGGSQETSIRNESGSGQFSGAAAQWDSDDNSASLGVETFTDGFDFSSTDSDGGFGFSGAMRGGMAVAGGTFGGYQGDGDDDDGGFPGLGLGHGGFEDGTPGNSDNWD